MKISGFIRDNSLAIAMLVGVAGFKWFSWLSPCLPYIIFLMLFFTFCKINPAELRLRKWHWLVLAFQLVMAVLSFYLLRMVDDVLAQGIMLCFIMPSATAAPVIASKLGGNLETLTTFTMLSNIITAFIVPVFFPLVYPQADMTFSTASVAILQKVTPLLLAPFFAAWLLRLSYDAIQKKRKSEKRFQLSEMWSQMPFYLWLASLVILMAQITLSLVSCDYRPWVVIAQAGGALIACILQFWAGKLIGQHFPLAETDTEVYRTRVSAGQALGQKNTTLGVWMAQTYLNPIAGMGAAAYIVWQNLFNSWQIMRQGRKNARIKFGRN